MERRREGKERGKWDRCTRTFEIQSGTVGGAIDDDTIIKVSFDISLGNGPEWHHVSSMSRRLRRPANGTERHTQVDEKYIRTLDETSPIVP